MLGLGRALGETIVVFLIISPMFAFTTHPLQSGTNTIAAHIAARYSESGGIALSGLLGAGLVLFLFTLVINTFAGVVVSRSRSGATTEI
jgi:phosphate transport system permease protein